MKGKKKKTKALVLLSGGLDSILAVKLLQEQGIEVTGIVFVSRFFNQTSAQKAAKQLKINLLVKDFSKSHLELVKNPPHGYGKNMNPCIDCHILMLKIAGKIMKQRGFDFVASGEVLGERPMSQNRWALQEIEKEAGLKGYLLRPLSAKLLEPTRPEKLGLVERKKLLGISGRQRKEQIKLVKKYKIRNFPTPSGGCLLTDPGFSERLKNLLKKSPQADCQDVNLLGLGRHLWQTNVLFVVGRNHEENLVLKDLAQRNDFLAEAKGVPGPAILVRNYGSDRIEKKDIEKETKELLIKYNKKIKDRNVAINWLG